MRSRNCAAGSIPLYMFQGGPVAGRGQSKKRIANFSQCTSEKITYYLLFIIPYAVYNKSRARHHFNTHLEKEASKQQRRTCRQRTSRMKNPAYCTPQSRTSAQRTHVTFRQSEPNLTSLTRFMPSLADLRITREQLSALSTAIGGQDDSDGPTFERAARVVT
eukprot:IDg19934t1